MLENCVKMRVYVCVCSLQLGFFKRKYQQLDKGADGAETEGLQDSGGQAWDRHRSLIPLKTVWSPISSSHWCNPQRHGDQMGSSEEQNLNHTPVAGNVCDQVRTENRKVQQSDCLLSTLENVSFFTPSLWTSVSDKKRASFPFFTFIWKSCKYYW